MKIVTNMFITEEEIKQILWDVYSGYGEVKECILTKDQDSEEWVVDITFVKDQEV
jgi:hypothetical protein